MDISNWLLESHYRSTKQAASASGGHDRQVSIFKSGWRLFCGTKLRLSLIRPAVRIPRRLEL